MASKRLWVTLLLLGFLVLAGADEGAEEATEDAGEPAGEADGVEGPVGPSEFAETITFFPDFPDKKFVLGELVHALCGFTNVGDKSFNITTMKGSLHSSASYQYIQNFTEISPFSEIKKGEQGTMEYRFMPDPKLDPKEYTLTLSIDYIDADKDEYRTVYFNSTIDVVESESSLTIRNFIGRIMMLAVLSVGLFYCYKHFQKMNAKKARRTAADSTSSGGATKDEWLQDVHAPGGPRRSGSGKKGNKSKAS